MVMSPQYFRSDVVYARFILSSSNNNCCLLYFNATIMCSFTKKLQLLGDTVPQSPDLLPGLRHFPIILWDRRPWACRRVDLLLATLVDLRRSRPVMCVLVCLCVWEVIFVLNDPGIWRIGSSWNDPGHIRRSRPQEKNGHLDWGLSSLLLPSM